MQIHSVVFVLSRQINKQNRLTSKNYANTVNLLCADNAVFVKYQAQGGFNPKQPPFRTPLAGTVYKEHFRIFCPNSLLKGKRCMHFGMCCLAHFNVAIA